MWCVHGEEGGGARSEEEQEEEEEEEQAPKVRTPHKDVGKIFFLKGNIGIIKKWGS